MGTVALGLLVGLVGAAQAQSPITASSLYDPRYQAEYAMDGDPATRWASAQRPGAAEWLQIDFGASVPLNTLSINWERACAVDYELQVSEDGQTWATTRTVTGGVDGPTTLEALGARGRYLRVLCTKPTEFTLYSIWEITSPDPETTRAFGNLKQRAEQARRAQADAARRRLADAVALSGAREILFVVRRPGVPEHWYANFGYYAANDRQKLYLTGGARLCALNAAANEVRTILEDPQGSLRDPQVHYDGRRIVFSYLKAGTESYHLYEINADGSGLRQLTDGDYDDIEPTYLPDGGLMFCSSRSQRWVNCWLTPVATLYRCEADGSGVRMISANVEHDNTPWPLSDGRILYQRWEYVDRSQVHYHHLWTANPDGTEQAPFFGNFNPGTVMIDAKPVPGSRQVVAIFSPGHGQHEHMGSVALVDPGDGPDDAGNARLISPGDNYRDPQALDQTTFLAARGSTLEIVTADGQAHPIYWLSDEEQAAGFWVHEPRLLAPRPAEKCAAPRVDLRQPTGRLILTDVYRGRNMAGVRRGEIKKLLVLESLPKPINYTGGMDPLTYGGTFTLERVLGTVPVEPDGSAYMEVPALRALFFVALDENNLSVKRMQSFLTVQPGETTSCVGCHEQRTEAVRAGADLLAMRRAPSPVTPVPGVPEVFDFPRDIQPILDRHCVACHEPDRREGGVLLTGDHGPMYSHSYFELTWLKQFVDGRNDPKSNLPPRSIGTSASPLMQKLHGAHYAAELTPAEIDLVRYWIESGAAYPGTYGALGGGSIGGYYANGLVETDFEWPETRAAAEIIDRRCAACHQGPNCLPRALSDEMDISFWRPDWSDPRLKHSRHIVFNLTRPGKSLMLLAPLAREAGGYGTCVRDARPVFPSTADAGYQAILAMVVAGQRRLDVIKRFDMPGFRPPFPYLREMARYGVLAELPGEGEPVDSYTLDQAYWRQQWWRAMGG
jgi:mono/diheme cytochrome c family protein